MNLTRKFINIRIEKLLAVNITTKQARGDASVLIIKTAIDESEHDKTAIKIG